jgi:hypothetical protein
MRPSAETSRPQYVSAAFHDQISKLLVAISISYNRSNMTDNEALSKDDVELLMSGVFPKAHCKDQRGG